MEKRDEDFYLRAVNGRQRLIEMLKRAEDKLWDCGTQDGGAASVAAEIDALLKDV